MLVCARLRHVAGTQWGNKKYMNMKHLEAAPQDSSLLADFIHSKVCKLICEKLLTLPSVQLQGCFLLVTILSYASFPATESSRIKTEGEPNTVKPEGISKARSFAYRFYLAEQLKKVTRYGKGAHRRALLAVLNEKTAALQRKNRL